MELNHCSFYRWHIVVAGHGDSMVAVHHEVGFLELVELDRRQVLAPLERAVYALPLIPHARPRGQEGSVELIPPPHAADALVYLYDPRPSVEAIVGRMLSSVLVEGEQPIRGMLSANTGH
jgi:hypothetical protein